MQESGDLQYMHMDALLSVLVPGYLLTSNTLQREIKS